MQKRSFHPPDAARVERAISDNEGRPAGTALLLAWRAGLTRAEIAALDWKSVDFTAALLRLSDREIPLDWDTVRYLRRWREICGPDADFVAWSPRTHAGMEPQTVSVAARKALTAAGLPEVRLLDLRYDFLRRQREARGWEYAMRVSGSSLGTCRNTASAGKRADASALDFPPQEDEEGRLRLLLRKERDTPAGLALWLLSSGLYLKEITALTWEQVELDRNMLSLPKREVFMSPELAKVLSAAYARREGDAPYVLSPKGSRGPYSEPRLSLLVRETLLRGGIEFLSAADIRKGALWGSERARIAEIAEQRQLDAKSAAALLGVTPERAAYLLRSMAEAGELVRTGRSYAAAGKTPPPEQRKDIILKEVSRNGLIFRQDAARLLNLTPRQAGDLLRSMTEDGLLELVLPARYYALPEH